MLVCGKCFVKKYCFTFKKQYCIVIICMIGKGLFSPYSIV